MVSVGISSLVLGQFPHKHFLYSSSTVCSNCTEGSGQSTRIVSEKLLVFCFPFFQFTTIISIFLPVTRPFHYECIRNEPTATAPDSPKIDVTVKSISQELKHIFHSQAVKSTEKLIRYCYITISLPLARYKHSFSIFYQSCPFHRVFCSSFSKIAPPCFSQSMTSPISMESVLKSLLIGRTHQ